MESIENITPLQALSNLYKASRLLNSNADTHEALYEMAKIIENALTQQKGDQDGASQNS